MRPSSIHLNFYYLILFVIAKVIVLLVCFHSSPIKPHFVLSPRGLILYFKSSFKVLFKIIYQFKSKILLYELRTSNEEDKYNFVLLVIRKKVA